MTFSPWVERLRELREGKAAPAQADPIPDPPALPQEAPRAAPGDPFVIGAQPGHCASCRRWTYDGWGLEGLCSAGKRAHGWLDGNPLLPVITSAHLSCQVVTGKGWQARGAG